MAKSNQNTNQSESTLDEKLALTNDELINNWSKLASLIRIAENKSWEAARQKALKLCKDKPKAIKYIESVRSGSVPKTNTKLSTKELVIESSEEDYQTLDEVMDIPEEVKRDRFSQNYKRLLKLAPDLESRLLAGEQVVGKSKVSPYQDFNLELIHRDKRGFYLAMSHYFKQNGDLVPDPDMVIRFDPKVQTVEALTLQNQFGYFQVYDDMYKPKLVDPREKKTQNAFLEKWLLDLINQDHQIDWLHDEQEDEPIAPKRQVTEKSEKKDRSESIAEKIKDKNAIANLYKANYQALLRLFPDINERLDNDLVNGRLVSSNEPKYGYKIEPAAAINKTTKQFVFHDENSEGTLIIAVQKVRKKAWVALQTNKVLPVHDYAYDLENLESPTINKVNEKLSQWLEGKIKTVTNIYWFDTRGLTDKAKQAIMRESEKSKAELNELIQKYPIVIEWSEGSGDYPKGFKTLGQLSKALLKNGFTSKPKETYIKNKVLFQGYPSFIRIDVSKVKGDFDPTKDDLLTYLESGDKQFNWSAFASKPKAKKLTEDDSHIFKVGDLVTRHKGKSVDNTIYRVQELQELSEQDDGFKVTIEDSLGIVDEIIEEKYLKLVMRADEFDAAPDSLKNKVMKPKTDAPKPKEQVKTVKTKSDTKEVRVEDYSFDPRHPIVVLDRDSPQWKSAFKEFLDEVKEFGNERKGYWEYTPEIEKPKDKSTPKFDLTEAQKDAATIPVFEIGKVEFTEQHKRAGLKKTDINWINKHKQGMILTPKKNMTNNTKSFGHDIVHKAKRPGKRISATGRIYYEGRSNRSDLTDSGL